MKLIHPYLKFISILFILAFIVIFIKGCGGLLATKILIDEGNAMHIEFERSHEAVLEDFSTYLEDNGMEIDSTTNNFVRTTAGSISGPMSDGQTLRIKGVVEPTDNGSYLVVITDYLDITSDDWIRANNKIKGLNANKAYTSSEGRAFQSVRQILMSRYGQENVKEINSDLEY